MAVAPTVTVSGVTASGLTLSDGIDTVAVAAGTSTVTFPRTLVTGTTYTVTIQSSPPGEACAVQNGTAMAGGSVVPAVACRPFNVYVLGDSGTTVSQFFVSADGALVSLNPAAVPTAAPASSIVAAAGSAYVYVLNASEQTISGFAVGDNGALTALNPATITVPGAPGSGVLRPDGSALYVALFTAGTGSSTVGQYRVGADGQLSAIAPPVAGSGTSVLAIDPSGQNLYAANAFGPVNIVSPPSPPSSIDHFAIAASGQLSYVATTQLPYFAPDGLAIAPDGAHGYVVCSFQFFGASPGTGMLVPLSIASDGAIMASFGIAVNFSPGGLTLNPTGRSLYVYGGSAFAVASDGTLSALTGVPAISGPFAITPDGLFAYEGISQVSSLSLFSVAAGGALTALSPPTVQTGGAAQSIAIH